MGSAARALSASPSDEGSGSPVAASPLTPSFRGSSWHPALRIHVGTSSASETSRRPRSVSSSSLWKDPESPSLRNLPSPHVELFGNLTTPAGAFASALSDTLQSQQSHRIPIHFVQSSVVVEDSPLSRVYTDYRDAARQLIAGGTPLSHVIGDLDFINVELYFRSRRNDPFSANFWACEALKSFNEFDHLIKLGFVALLTHLMRVCDPVGCLAKQSCADVGTVDYSSNGRELRECPGDDETNAHTITHSTRPSHRYRPIVCPDSSTLCRLTPSLLTCSGFVVLLCAMR